MKPRIDPASNSTQQKLFDASAPLLLEFIDTKHELVKLADSIEWEIFEEHWRKQFSDAGGQMANSGRRVAGLLMIQHMENLSDEGLVAQWVLNPYYQYFCGEVHFQHRHPINPATLVKWRKRLGEEGFEWMLTAVLESALRCGAVDARNLAHVCVDSTVMEKNIAYPTDSALLEKLRKKMVGFMKKKELTIRQSYSRQGPRLAQQVGHHAHAKQFKRMRKALKKQSNWMGRLQGELERQLDGIDDNTTKAHAENLISLAKRLIAQTRNPKQKDKIYALHEPDVDCISKGKARKRYEFGAKVGIVCTQKEGFVIGMRSYAGNPYDGHTLVDMLCQAKAISGVKAKTAAVDLGYRGRHETKVKVIHRGKKLSNRDKKRLRRRSMLEAMIGHMKNEGRLERCPLKGKDGDAIHALLCGIGHNLRLLRAHWRALIFWLLNICQQWPDKAWFMRLIGTSTTGEMKNNWIVGATT